MYKRQVVVYAAETYLIVTGPRCLEATYREGEGSSWAAAPEERNFKKLKCYRISGVDANSEKFNPKDAFIV